MIRSDSEYQQAQRRLDEERVRLDRYAEAWKAEGYGDAEVATLRAPLESFHAQLLEEIEAYERLRRGQFDAIENLQGIGQTLVGLRIASGLSQRELAGAIGINETQISRYERNEYRGVSIERANTILEALGARLVTHVEGPPSPREAA